MFTHLPSYPGRANFSSISLQNLVNRLHEKQKVGSDRRLTTSSGRGWGLPEVSPPLSRYWWPHPSSPANISLLWLAQLAGTTRSRLDKDSMRKHCWLGQSGQFFPHINARKSWLGWEVDLLSGTAFLHPWVPNSLLAVTFEIYRKMM